MMRLWQRNWDVLSCKVPEGVPTDRFIIGVTIPSISDPDSDAGYFSDYEDEEKKVRLTAVKGAAQWVLVLDKKYTKVGISIVNAQDDYFNSSFIYKNIRGAIGIMNYAPQKIIVNMNTKNV